MQHLPVHPTLTHPHTGEPLRAIGFARRGPIWPIIGASEDDADSTQAPDSKNADESTETESKAGDQPGDKELGDGGKKAIQAEREARKAAEKERAALEKRVKEFEDSQKSESEKAAEKQQELERAAADNAAKALRYEIAEKAGLPLSAAGRLKGNDEKELFADAEELKKLLGNTAAPQEPGKPKPDPSQGNGGGNPAPKNLNDAIAGHYNT